VNTPEAPWIRLEQVSKIFQQGAQTIRAVDQVSLEVAPGEFLAITGASGSGKSTLLHLIAGLETPTSGTVGIGGVVLETMDDTQLSTLRLRSHRALYSRIAVHARIEGLSRSEVEPYLEHQLRQVGIERPCFEPAAIELLASASEGIPRTINLVARAAWIQAAKDKSLQISAAHLQSALDLVPGVMEIRQNSSSYP